MYGTVQISGQLAKKDKKGGGGERKKHKRKEKREKARREAFQEFTADDYYKHSPNAVHNKQQNLSKMINVTNALLCRSYVDNNSRNLLSWW